MENGKITTAEDVRSVVKEVIGPELADFRDNIIAAVKEAKAADKPAEVEVDPVRRNVYVHPFGAKTEQQALRHEKLLDKPGVKLARFIRLHAIAGGSSELALRQAKHWRDDVMVSAIEESIERSLNESVLSAGGALVPPEWLNEITEELYARTVVRGAGATSIPMNNGTLTIPYQDGTATGTYGAELQAVSPSQPGTGLMELIAKKLRTLVPISNDLLRDASPRADVFVQRDLMRILAVTEDQAFLRGDGTASNPKGIRFLAQSAQAASGTALANINDDLHDAVLALQNANVLLLAGCWISNPTVGSAISRVLDADGNFVFKDEMAAGMLLGFPWKQTTSMPSNLGVGSNESEVLFVDMDTAVIAEADEMEIRVFEGGAYDDGAGNLISGISTDQTIMRAIARHDFGLRQRGREAHVITGVQY